MGDITKQADWRTVSLEHSAAVTGHLETKEKALSKPHILVKDELKMNVDFTKNVQS